MADETPETTEAPAAAAPPEQAAQPKSRVLAQYIRDLSFENILAQKGASPDAKPEIKVQVNLDAKKRSVDNQFEIITKLNITSSAKDSGEALFVLELEYAGIFLVENVPEDQMHPYLLIECPRITFPFVRRVVSDVTRDGGFPPLNLETIDFLALYRAEIARRVEAQKTEATVQ
ncbi:protein-export chaperone SecB [Yoonia sp.]|jgi:preprotein translocase subunit SecB|uniref:protein-export chaperone SecB n=1 Tax=Yoonia sp. TaxID=2212373 RepID=UPI00238E76A8|nr:protein-export chaperone SecB [Yoonia sp.]MDE0850977.1 protein-export chaperone SecB [Yoonia sp.]